MRPRIFTGGSLNGGTWRRRRGGVVPVELVEVRVAADSRVVIVAQGDEDGADGWLWG